MPSALQWGRRLLATESCSGEARVRFHLRFNGAVACWRRKGEAVVFFDPLATDASMGPSPVGDGKRAMAPLSMRRMEELQWGRRLLATERGQGRERSTRLYVASMGPSPVGDGKPSTPGAASAPIRASMGPSPVGDGKMEQTWFSRLEPDGLQWGRRLLATERTCPPTERARTIWLQWGRRLLATESCRSRAPVRPHNGASMGPSPVGDGKLPAWMMAQAHG